MKTSKVVIISMVASFVVTCIIVAANNRVALPLIGPPEGEWFHPRPDEETPGGMRTQPDR